MTGRGILYLIEKNASDNALDRRDEISLSLYRLICLDSFVCIFNEPPCNLYKEILDHYKIGMEYTQHIEQLASGNSLIRMIRWKNFNA